MSGKRKKASPKASQPKAKRRPKKTDDVPKWSVDKPPTWIRLSNGAPISKRVVERLERECPWSSRKAANDAANRQGDRLRHAGYVDLTFDLPQILQKKNKEKLLQKLTALGSRDVVDGFTAKGEPETDANVAGETLRVNLVALHAQLKPRGTTNLLSSIIAECIIELQRTDVLWRIPLLRAQCIVERSDLEAQMEGGSALQLRVHVYFNRLLFEIISDDHLRFLMVHLRTPGGSASVRPVQAPIHTALWGEAQVRGHPSRVADLEEKLGEQARWLEELERLKKGQETSYSRAELNNLTRTAKENLSFFAVELCYAREQPPIAPTGQERHFTAAKGSQDDELEDDPFSLASILRNCVSLGYRESDRAQPGELSVRLLQYQRETVQWMIDMESLEGGLNSLFWETRKFEGSSEEYYYFPLGGELRLTQPPTVTGGMLCEEMGMGKTLEVLALILQDTYRRRAVCTPDGSNKKTFHVKSSATLIIVPMTLLSQWLLEVDKCTRQGTVKVGVYNHGDMTKGLKKKLTDLADCDIVFAHYGDLERATHLRKVHWRRILLDECQMIRSSTTQIAKNCRSLVSQHRWLVSGTPLYSGIGDLNGILAFLKIYPFSLSDSEDGFFGLRVGQPFAAKSANSLKLVMELCDKIIMRHSKRQRHLGTSKPILELPGSTFAHQPIRLTTHLKYTALFTELRCRLELQRQLGMARGVVKDVSRLVNMPMLCSTSALAADFGPNKTLFHDLDKIMRKAILAGAGEVGHVSSYGLKTLPPQEVIEVLMRPLINEGTSRDQEAGYVRTDQRERGLYNRSRAYAVGDTVQAKHDQALKKMMQLEQDFLAVKDNLVFLRWRYAVEALASGACITSLARSSLKQMRAVFGALATTPVKRSKRVLSMKRDMTELIMKRSDLEQQLLSLKPYVNLLASSIKKFGGELNASVCEQSGFQGLNDLEEGRASAVTCCICLHPVEDPVVTRCVHIGCAKCIIAWLEASTVLNKKKGTAPCPLCRQEFSLNNLISIKLEESDKCKTCQAGGIQDKRKSAAGSEVETEAEALRDAPSHCKAVEEEDYTSIPLPAEGMVPRDARFPALSRWLAFMSHASAARCKTFVSPKHAWLRNLLGELEKREKVVIFSQFTSSLKHTAKVLAEWGIGCKLIMSGMAKAERADAIGEFNINPDVRVFLLHASAAAAGLTLTAARTCILMEPFLSVGDEQQAVNRIHRIGQEAEVRCYTLYTQGTIEERILAWRLANEGNQDRGEEGLSVLPSSQEVTQARAKFFFNV